MRKATLVAALAAAFGFAGAAQADGMYSKGAVSYKDAPIVVSGPVWTGFYVGAGIGAGSANYDLKADAYGSTTISYHELNKNGYGASTGYYSNSATSARVDSFAGDGAFATLQVGYDRQLNKGFVIGVFADIDFANSKAKASAASYSDYYKETCAINKHQYHCKSLGVGSVSGAGSFEVELNNVWSIGGRLGYLVNPHTLLYGLLAYTEADVDVKVWDWKKDKTFSGYTVGAGLETALKDNWFLKGEYRYTDLGSEKVFDDYGLYLSAEPDIHTARLVLTYKFGRGGHAAPLK